MGSNWSKNSWTRSSVKFKSSLFAPCIFPWMENGERGNWQGKVNVLTFLFPINWEPFPIRAAHDKKRESVQRCRIIVLKFRRREADYLQIAIINSPIFFDPDRIERFRRSNRWSSHAHTYGPPRNDEKSQSSPRNFSFFVGCSQKPARYKAPSATLSGRRY